MSESGADTIKPVKPERHGKAWSEEEERSLYVSFVKGTSTSDMAATHQRTHWGIVGQLKNMGLLNEDGEKITPVPEYRISPIVQKRALKETERSEKKKEFAKKIALRKGSDVEEPVALSTELNDRFKHALNLMENTNKHLFITGKAGTGKSTLLGYFCQNTDKSPVVLAPTGVAALNVKGQTIHSFFNFYVDVTPESIKSKKKKPRDPKIYKKLKTIIVDEVSMVRADILDCMDIFLRLYGPHTGQPFGGVQMIFIGDLFQLPPVVGNEEKDIFESHYKTPYFFSAHVFDSLEGVTLETIELEKIYRQKDQDFVDLLGRIRNNRLADNDIETLNGRVIRNDTLQTDGTISLTTTNQKADEINDAHLNALKGKLYRNPAEVEGTVGKEYFPTAPDLQFKIGAQIMLLNNDAKRRWVNGSIGVIEAIKHDGEDKEYLSVRLADTRKTVEVYPHTWEVFKSGIEQGALVSFPVGSFTQYPFRLAWAITIHKSQGKTFEKVVIDIGRGTFASGQIYVALSRCTSFEGVVLKTPLAKHHIRTDFRIFDFLTRNRYLESENDMSLDDKIVLIQQCIKQKTPLAITYLKADNTQTDRTVIPFTVGEATYQGKKYQGMKAVCTLRDEERMFRVDRILKIEKG